MVDMLATGTAATAVTGTSAALTGATGSIAVVLGGIPKMAAANVTVAVAPKGAKATTGKH
jgi:hypothetical protein